MIKAGQRMRHAARESPGRPLHDVRERWLWRQCEYEEWDRPKQI
jgi:hypothetical protein